MTDLLPAALPAIVIPAQATSDTGLVDLWLRNYRSPHTRRRYAADARAFLLFADKPLAHVIMADVQAFGATLETRSPATAAARLTGVKSLISFAHRIGYLRFDVAAPLQLPAVQDRLAERIVTEFDMQRMLGLERHPRNATILRTLYSTGLRISELCGLRWRDLLARDEGGQLSVLGKGSKTRPVLLPVSIWDRINQLRGSAGPDAPVFRSRKGGGLQPRQVHDIVKRAAARAKLPGVSAHWFRHSHASHSLDHGWVICVRRQDRVSSFRPLWAIPAYRPQVDTCTSGRVIHPPGTSPRE